MRRLDKPAVSFSREAALVSVQKPERHRILLIEDSTPVRAALRVALEAAQYQVLEAPSGEDGLAKTGEADIVLLDLGLPGISGFEVLEKLRQTSSMPVVILSGQEEVDAKIRGLDLGADDYVTKPFDPGELLARVRAALRRGQESAAAANGTSIVTVGPFVIDPLTGDTRRDDRPVRLSPMEARFVKMLAQKSGQPVGTKQLTITLWGNDNAEMRQALRVLARKVRCKLEKDPDAPRFLLTEPRLGYRLINPETAAHA